MVMIDTSTREPQRTIDDIADVLTQAKTAGMVPIGFEIGFFQARDVADIAGDFAMGSRGWRQERRWKPCTHLQGVNCVVSQLEDRVTLFAQSADGKVVRQFQVDRRASSI
jgi:hypothetical protein